MLWVFEPVKYWQAAPNCFGSTTRRSTCRPVVVSTEVLVSPLPITSRTVGIFTNASRTAAGSLEAATMSTSATVSRSLRRLPQYRARSTSGRAWRAATNSSAIGSATEIGRRSSGPDAAIRSIACCSFSSAFAPRPRSSRTRWLASAALSSSRFETPSSLRSRASVLGPTPGIRLSSTKAGGYLRRSDSSLAIVPLS